MPRSLFCSIGLLLLLFGDGRSPVQGAEPSTVLYDVRTTSLDGLSEATLSQGNALTLEEDDLTHRFQGMILCANDRLVGALAPNTAELQLFSRQASPWTLLARLQPLAEGQVDLPRTSLAIRENNRGTIRLEVDFRTPSGSPGTIAYELNAGASFVKTTRGKHVDKLRVQAPCRYAVLPDFFGDDMVVDAAAIPVPRTEIPSEHFLLHLRPGGEAIVMTVSESRDTDVEITLTDGLARNARQISASDLAYGTLSNVWVAALTDKGIWHEHTVRAEDAGRVLDLGWRQPFPALWRVDWSTADHLTDSWEMLLQDPTGKYVMQNWFGQAEAEGQRFGQEFGPRDWNKPNRGRWNPVLGSFLFPCWIDQNGRGFLQPLKERRYAEGGAIHNFLGPALIYPMDRVKVAPFQTPLESLTVVDLVRMTLGVGPCQYILDLEGQKRNSRGVATCYARDVINALYKEGRQLDNRPLIEEQLNATVAFISNVRERIDEYVKWGHELRTYLQERKRLQPSHTQLLDELIAVTARLDELFQAAREQIRSPEYARRQAEAFRAQLLSYTGQDAAGKCAAQMAVFTSIGGAQDGLVASCRMIVKTLRQRSALALALHPDFKETATEIRARTQSILRNPTPYEAPRH